VISRSQKSDAPCWFGRTGGQAVVAAYWAAAFKKQPDLSFVVVDVLHGYGMVVITYRNQHNILAAETLRFGLGGMVVEASVCHAKL
jgi:hypothetical protein|tara:strand:- start:2298 stop:2555 length:258 start_codon:yes stop_codon:yes gene_type:complete